MTSAPTHEDERAPCRRVLLVDDNADVARSMARLVRKLGHDIHLAFTGWAAIEDAERLQPQIILMDIGLPDLSGIARRAEIRSKPWGKSVTLIALSGWERASDRRRALDAGFDQYLIKPVDADVFEALLNGPPRCQA